MLQAYVFKGKSGKCVAFLVNNDSRKDVTVVFQNTSYELPRKSISILPDCKIEAFNTAKVKLASDLKLKLFRTVHKLKHIFSIIKLSSFLWCSMIQLCILQK